MRRKHFSLGVVSRKKQQQLLKADDQLWRIAEQVCDDIMGKGKYEEINGFSPRRGEHSRLDAELNRERKARAQLGKV